MWQVIAASSAESFELRIEVKTFGLVFRSDNQ